MSSNRPEPMTIDELDKEDFADGPIIQVIVKPNVESSVKYSPDYIFSLLNSLKSERFKERPQTMSDGIIVKNYQYYGKFIEYLKFRRDSCIEYGCTYPYFYENALIYIGLCEFQAQILWAVNHIIKIFASMKNDNSALNFKVYVELSRTKHFRWITSNKQPMTIHQPNKKLPHDLYFLGEMDIDYNMYYAGNVSKVLRFNFDHWANLLGWNSSPCYDIDGAWVHQPHYPQ